RQGALAQRLALQVDEAVLGDEVLHVHPRRRHDCPAAQPRHDPRDLAIVCRGVEGQEGFAALRLEGRAHEVELAAGAAVLVAAEHSTRSSMPLLSSSVWMPRSLWSRSERATASGMPPMPSWSVAPSGTSAAMARPITSSSGRGGCGGTSISGTSFSTIASTS